MFIYWRHGENRDFISPRNLDLKVLCTGGDQPFILSLLLSCPLRRSRKNRVDQRNAYPHRSRENRRQEISTTIAGGYICSQATPHLWILLAFRKRGVAQYMFTYSGAWGFLSDRESISWGLRGSQVSSSCRSEDGRSRGRWNFGRTSVIVRWFIRINFEKRWMLAWKIRPNKGRTLQPGPSHSGSGLRTQILDSFLQSRFEYFMSDETKYREDDSDLKEWNPMKGRL